MINKPLVKVLLLLIVSLCLWQNRSYAANHQYLLDFSNDINEVDVRIILHKPVRSLRARDSYSGLFTRRPVTCDTGESIEYRNSRLFLSPEINCLEYSMQLVQKQDKRLFGQKYSTMVSTPAEWLFLPNLRNSESVDITVKYAEEYNFSTPWDKVTEKQYRVTASPQSGDGLIILGKFEQRELSHGGTNLRVAYIPGSDVDYDQIDAWLLATVDNISTVYGRFPHKSPQIIISPVAKSWSRKRSPVPFGRVVRDAGESVQFFIDQRQNLNQFKADWTATHEFAHLLLPYVNWNNRWLSEGFASYYQNILMARSGEYSQHKAWQKLYEGFKRGERAAPELSPNSAAREAWGANMKVYWSGAALALLADVRLRQLSNGEKSLDTTLGALQRCCLPSSRTWSGSQLMRKLDQLSKTRVFTDLYKEYANAPGFFPYEQAFSELGIEIKYGRIHLENDSLEKRELRESIILPE